MTIPSAREATAGPPLSMSDWLATPAGRCLLGWHCAQVDDAVANVFGFHALQLGAPELPGLQANRMPHRWLAVDPVQWPAPCVAPDVLLDSTALPFPQASLDLVVLPYTLELSSDPHATLREVERVLVPEGRVVICGLNPWSLWALRQRRARAYRRLGLQNSDLYLPDSGQFIGYWRLRDWLRLLSFEVETGRFGVYQPAVDSPVWLRRLHWLNRLGQRWWPILGAGYFLVAVKRVRGLRLIEPAWKPLAHRMAKPATLANRTPE